MYESNLRTISGFLFLSQTALKCSPSRATATGNKGRSARCTCSYIAPPKIVGQTRGNDAYTSAADPPDCHHRHSQSHSSTPSTRPPAPAPSPPPIHPPRSRPWPTHLADFHLLSVLHDPPRLPSAEPLLRPPLPPLKPPSSVAGPCASIASASLPCSSSPPPLPLPRPRCCPSLLFQLLTRLLQDAFPQ